MSATRRFLVIILASATLSAFGSGVRADDELAAVSGEVKLDGKAPSGGRIFFHQEDGQFVGAKLDKDGKFKVDRVLVGKHKVTFEFKGVPAKYTSDEMSGLQAVVVKGKNVFNFELLSK